LNRRNKNNSEDYQDTITQLRRVLNYVYTFTDGEECIQFIADVNDDKVYMIISVSFGQ
jgi:hypothetical protein